LAVCVQALAYVYSEDEPARRSAAKLLTKDEARRIAASIAKLPDYSRRLNLFDQDQVSSPRQSLSFFRWN